jgi:hypothetical protein
VATQPPLLQRLGRYGELAAGADCLITDAARRQAAHLSDGSPAFLRRASLPADARATPLDTQPQVKKRQGGAQRYKRAGSGGGAGGGEGEEVSAT